MIFNIIDGALEKIGVPFYEHMPEFAEGEADELFFSYSNYDRPQLHRDGAEIVTWYFVMVNVKIVKIIRLCYIEKFLNMKSSIYN